MPVHQITTNLIKDNGLYQTINVSFSYYLPEQYRQWQDSQLGSITLLEVLSLDEQSILSSLSVNEHINIRREC